MRQISWFQPNLRDKEPILSQQGWYRAEYSNLR
jgi:hypothetical protein